MTANDIDSAGSTDRLQVLVDLHLDNAAIEVGWHPKLGRPAARGAVGERTKGPGPMGMEQHSSHATTVTKGYDIVRPMCGSADVANPINGDDSQRLRRRWCDGSFPMVRTTGLSSI